MYRGTVLLLRKFIFLFCALFNVKRSMKFAVGAFIIQELGATGSKEDPN